MAIDKIGNDGLKDEVTTNPEFSGTEGTKMPVGTTAQRANAQGGDIRFNSTLALMEYYDGALWKAIDSPPTITSVSPTTFAATGATITIAGSNFQTGVNVALIASDGTTYTPDSVTRVSSSSVTFAISSAINADEADPWDVKVTNTSGLSVTSADALTLAGTISLNTAAGSLGTVFDSQIAALSYNLGVTNSSSESDVSFTYSVSAGSLPSGLSLNTSTGAVTGTPSAVGSDTTSNFTITYVGADASDSSYAPTAGTAYSLTIAAPVITSYTSTGSGTFSVPSGVSLLDVLVVAGGGGGGCWVASGAGAGGLIYRPAFPVTPGGSVSYTVGSGGGGAYNDGSYSQLHDNVRDFPQRGQEGTNAAKIGQDSVFGTLTARGGGRGGSYAPSQSGHTHTDGGSGGGAPASTDQTAFAAGNTKTSDKIHAGIQSQQPGESGQYGFGNPGGYVGQSDPFSPNYYGGGGGGAGGAGSTSNGQSGPAGNGGVGKQYAISGSQVYYAGGGAGGKHGTSPSGTAVGQGGNGGGGQGFGQVGATVNPNANGTANRGGGAGGVGYTGGQASRGGTGGSGIVIVKY